MLFVVVAVVMVCEENGADAVFGGRQIQKNISHNVDNSALEQNFIVAKKSVGVPHMVELNNQASSLEGRSSSTLRG